MLTKQRLIHCLKKLAICSLVAGSAVVLIGGSNNHTNAELVQEVYTVQRGDTLWTISDKYMQKNDYGPRDIREFVSGIVESNYDDVFKYRDGNHDIYPNDQLKINYWVKKGDKPND
jgi:nucleoid-associated protein YgaU